MKLPLKIVPLGSPYLPEPITTKLEPVLEKTPPPRMLPWMRAPVEKLTEPRECPGGAVTPLNLISSDPRDTIPALVRLTEPNSLTKYTLSAKAAIGNSSVQRPSTTATRFIIASPQFQRPFPPTPLRPPRVQAHPPTVSSP